MAHGHELAKTPPTPEAVWRVHTAIVSLLQRAGTLCLDLAEGHLTDEAAIIQINNMSRDLNRVTDQLHLTYWFGRAYAEQLPKQEPTNPLLASLHIGVVKIVFYLLQPILAHQIVNDRALGSIIKVPQVLSGAVDLEKIAVFASGYKHHFAEIGGDYVHLLRGEAELACKLLSEQRIAVDNQADDTGQSAAVNVDNISEPARQPNPISVRALEVLLGEETAEILEIVRSKQSSDDKLRAICRVDQRCLNWDSNQWAEVLGVTASAIRQTSFWQEHRATAREAHKS